MIRLLLLIALLMVTTVSAQSPAPSEIVSPNESHEPLSSGENVAQPRSADDVLYRALIHDVQEAVVKDFRERQDWYWGMASMAASFVVVFLAFVGIREIRDIRSATQELVKSEIQNAAIRVREDLRTFVVSDSFQNEIQANMLNLVREEIRAESNVIRRDANFIRLQARAQRIKEGSQFSNSERDSVMTGLVSVSNDERIKQDPEFPVVLENIVEAFYQAGLWPQLDRIEDMFPNRCKDIPGICSTMFQSFMLRCLGEAEVGDRINSKFIEYFKAMKGHHSASLFLETAYLAFLYWQSGNIRNQQVENLLDDITSVENDALEVAKSFIVNQANPSSIAKDPKAIHLRFSQKYSVLLTFPEFNSKSESVSNALQN